MWTEDEIVLISALEHYSYCPRQCALIHVERIFDENVFTLRGRHAHERADEAKTTHENGIRMERALPLWSDTWGLYGIGDVIEFHPDGRVVPIEYKNGPKRASRHDDIQLCAQALCLEEMLGVAVTDGAIYSLKTHRRRAVAFSSGLRELTQETIRLTRQALASDGALPPPVNDKRCPHCSLIDACAPAALVTARQRALSASPWETLS